MEMLNWMGEHPILTVVILVIVLSGFVEMINAFFKRKS